jgi:glycosyltransferase involved in cell wall biosynthesis
MGAKTEIWYLMPALMVGGTERTLVELANELDQRRFDATIWTFFDDNALASELDDHVDHRTLGAQWADPEVDAETERPASPLDYVRVPVRFLRIARAERPDVIQSFLTFDNVVARVAGLLSPETVVVSGNRLVPGDDPPLKQRLDDWTLSLADHVVSNSEAGAHYVRRHGVDLERVSVIKNGRDLSAYGRSTANLRESLGLEPTTRIVGTVGRLVERKGHQELLDAWTEIAAERSDVHLVIVGDGPERDALRRRAERNGVADRVSLLGTRDDVPDLLGDFDVFAFPSRSEGLPGALVEAMAAELPIVTTPVDGNAELITDGETGLHVPVRDPSALADALRRLLDDPELAQRLGKRAGETAREEYAIERLVSDFERLYDRLTGRRDATARPVAGPP